MDRAAKAENSIKTTCDSLGISPEGRKWLDVALDPFKDIQQKPTGYPDRVCAQSVVQTVHQSLDITKPATATGNWDCNIFLDTAWVDKQLFVTPRPLSTVTTMFQNTSQEANPYQRGGLVIRSGPSGVPLSILQTSNKSLSLVTDVFQNDTSCRILGIGFEVHNTTAELNKQGSVITYRVDDVPYVYPTTVVKDKASASSCPPYDTMELVDPPTTAGEAIDLPGSLQWDAAHGVYVVPLFNQPSNPPVDLRAMPLLEVTSDTFYYQKINFDTTIAYIGDAGNAPIPITLSGAYFTGLSPETTLTLNLTYYVEQFPNFSSPLHRLTSPSCPDDYKAIELYTKVARHLPTGVKVNDNFAGAFVSGIATLMRAAIPHIPRLLNIGSSIGGLIQQARPTPSLPVTTTTKTVVTKPKAPLLDLVEAGTDIGKAVIAHRNQPSTTTTTTTQVVKPANNARRHRIRNKRPKNFDRLSEYSARANAGNRYM